MKDITKINRATMAKHPGIRSPYNAQFLFLLTHPEQEISIEFEKYVRRHLGHENLLFWRRCHEYSILKEHNTLKSKVMYSCICDEFVRIGAPLEVNLDDMTRKWTLLCSDAKYGTKVIKQEQTKKDLRYSKTNKVSNSNSNNSNRINNDNNSNNNNSDGLSSKNGDGLVAEKEKTNNLNDETENKSQISYPTDDRKFPHADGLAYAQAQVYDLMEQDIFKRFFRKQDVDIPTGCLTSCVKCKTFNLRPCMAYKKVNNNSSKSKPKSHPSKRLQPPKTDENGNETGTSDEEMSFMDAINSPVVPRTPKLRKSDSAKQVPTKGNSLRIPGARKPRPVSFSGDSLSNFFGQVEEDSKKLKRSPSNGTIASSPSIHSNTLSSIATYPSMANSMSSVHGLVTSETLSPSGTKKILNKSGSATSTSTLGSVFSLGNLTVKDKDKEIKQNQPKALDGPRSLQDFRDRGSTTNNHNSNNTNSNGNNNNNNNNNYNDNNNNNNHNGPAHARRSSFNPTLHMFSLSDHIHGQQSPGSSPVVSPSSSVHKQMTIQTQRARSRSVSTNAYNNHSSSYSSDHVFGGGIGSMSNNNNNNSNNNNLNNNNNNNIATTTHNNHNNNSNSYSSNSLRSPRQSDSSQKSHVHSHSYCAGDGNKRINTNNSNSSKRNSVGFYVNESGDVDATCRVGDMLSGVEDLYRPSNLGDEQFDDSAMNGNDDCEEHKHKIKNSYLKAFNYFQKINNGDGNSTNNAHAQDDIIHDDDSVSIAKKKLVNSNSRGSGKLQLSTTSTRDIINPNTYNNQCPESTVNSPSIVVEYAKKKLGARDSGQFDFTDELLSLPRKDNEKRVLLINVEAPSPTFYPDPKSPTNLANNYFFPTSSDIAA